jgi:hypothetical protein
MRIGSFFFGWERVSESERIDLGLPPAPGGWEVLCIEFAGRGTTLSARPVRRNKRENTP